MSANGIAWLPTKEERQLQKLLIAEAKRQGRVVADDGTISGSVDPTKPYYRVNNNLDISELPTVYSGNDVYNNPNVDGLVQGRPWVSGPTSTLLMDLDGSFVPDGGYWADQSSNNHPGIINNATYTASPGAFLFNGTDSSIELFDDFINWDTGQPFTISLWFKSLSDGIILGQTNNSNFAAASGWVPAIYMDTNGDLRVSTFWHGGTSEQTVTSGLNDNQWHHLTITYDGSTQAVYVNGEFSGELTTGQGPYGSGTYYYRLGYGKTSAGWAHSGNVYWTGLLGSFKVWTDAMIASAVATEYNNTKARFYPELNYSLDNGSCWSGSGTTIVDLSGNGHTGTLVNGPTVTSTTIAVNQVDSSYIVSDYNLPASNWSVRIIMNMNPASFWAAHWGNEAWAAGNGFAAFSTSATSIVLTRGGQNQVLTCNTTHQGTTRQYDYTYDGTTWTVYINGVSAGSATDGTVVIPTVNGIFFGARHDNNVLALPTDFNDATFYQMQVYETTLSAERIAADYATNQSIYGI